MSSSGHKNLSEAIENVCDTVIILGKLGYWFFPSGNNPLSFSWEVHQKLDKRFKFIIESFLKDPEKAEAWRIRGADIFKRENEALEADITELVAKSGEPPDKNGNILPPVNQELLAVLRDEYEFPETKARKAIASIQVPSSEEALDTETRAKALCEAISWLSCHAEDPDLNACITRMAPRTLALAREPKALQISREKYEASGLEGENILHILARTLHFHYFAIVAARHPQLLFEEFKYSEAISVTNPVSTTTNTKNLSSVFMKQNERRNAAFVFIDWLREHSDAVILTVPERIALKKEIAKESKSHLGIFGIQCGTVGYGGGDFKQQFIRCGLLESVRAIIEGLSQMSHRKCCSIRQCLFESFFAALHSAPLKHFRRKCDEKMCNEMVPLVAVCRQLLSQCLEDGRKEFESRDGYDADDERSQLWPIPFIIKILGPNFDADLVPLFHYFTWSLLSPVIFLAFSHHLQGRPSIDRCHLSQRELLEHSTLLSARMTQNLVRFVAEDFLLAVPSRISNIYLNTEQKDHEGNDQSSSDKNDQGVVGKNVKQYMKIKRKTNSDLTGVQQMRWSMLLKWVGGDKESPTASTETAVSDLWHDERETVDFCDKGRLGFFVAPTLRITQAAHPVTDNTDMHVIEHDGSCASKRFVRYGGAAGDNNASAALITVQEKDIACLAVPENVIENSRGKSKDPGNFDTDRCNPPARAAFMNESECSNGNPEVPSKLMKLNRETTVHMLKVAEMVESCQRGFWCTLVQPPYSLDGSKQVFKTKKTRLSALVLVEARKCFPGLPPAVHSIFKAAEIALEEDSEKLTAQVDSTAAKNEITSLTSTSGLGDGKIGELSPTTLYLIRSKSANTYCRMHGGKFFGFVPEGEMKEMKLDVRGNGTNCVKKDDSDVIIDADAVLDFLPIRVARALLRNSLRLESTLYDGETAKLYYSDSDENGTAGAGEVQLNVSTALDSDSENGSLWSEANRLTMATRLCLQLFDGDNCFRRDSTKQYGHDFSPSSKMFGRELRRGLFSHGPGNWKTQPAWLLYETAFELCPAVTDPRKNLPTHAEAVLLQLIRSLYHGALDHIDFAGKTSIEQESPTKRCCRDPLKWLAPFHVTTVAAAVRGSVRAWIEEAGSCPASIIEILILGGHLGFVTGIFDEVTAASDLRASSQSRKAFRNSTEDETILRHCPQMNTFELSWVEAAYGAAGDINVVWFSDTVITTAAIDIAAAAQYSKDSSYCSRAIKLALRFIEMHIRLLDMSFSEEEEISKSSQAVRLAENNMRQLLLRCVEEKFNAGILRLFECHGLLLNFSPWYLCPQNPQDSLLVASHIINVLDATILPVIKQSCEAEEYAKSTSSSSGEDDMEQDWKKMENDSLATRSAALKVIEDAIPVLPGEIITYILSSVIKIGKVGAWQQLMSRVCTRASREESDEGRSIIRIRDKIRLEQKLRSVGAITDEEIHSEYLCRILESQKLQDELLEACLQKDLVSCELLDSAYDSQNVSDKINDQERTSCMWEKLLIAIERSELTSLSSRINLAAAPTKDSKQLPLHDIECIPIQRLHFTAHAVATGFKPSRDFILRHLANFVRKEMRHGKVRDESRNASKYSRYNTLLRWSSSIFNRFEPIEFDKLDSPRKCESEVQVYLEALALFTSVSGAGGEGSRPRSLLKQHEGELADGCGYRRQRSPRRRCRSIIDNWVVDCDAREACHGSSCGQIRVAQENPFLKELRSGRNLFTECRTFSLIAAAAVQGRLRSARRMEAYGRAVLLPWVIQSSEGALRHVPLAIKRCILSYLAAWEEMGPYSDTRELETFEGLMTNPHRHELQMQERRFAERFKNNRREFERSQNPLRGILKIWFN